MKRLVFEQLREQLRQRLEAEWEFYRTPEGLIAFARHCKIVDRQTGTVFSWQPENGWEWQKDILLTIQQTPRLIILKARQLGISWLLAIYSLWKAMFFPNTLILILSRNRETAMDMIERVFFSYSYLPNRLKVGYTHKTQHRLAFANKSEILTQPSTPEAGRGYDASLIIADEFAYHKYAKENYAAIYPAIEAGGQLIIVSTANGHNFFWQIWNEAKKGTNGFVPIFCPYNLRPGRDEAWRAEKAKEMAEWELAQEFPETEEDAFVQSGRPVFPIKLLEALELPQPLPTPPSLTELEPHVLVFEEPVEGHWYVIGADPAEGLASGDWSAACVIDGTTGRQVAELACREPPDVFASFLSKLADYYQACKVIVERNNQGVAVLQKLKELGVTRIYRQPRKGQPEFQEHYREGFQTTVKTKPYLIALLEEGLRKGTFRPQSKALIEEMMVYERDEDGSTSAPEGYHDDRIMAAALAFYLVNTLKSHEKHVYTKNPMPSPVQEYFEMLEEMMEDATFLRPNTLSEKPYLPEVRIFTP